MEKKKRKSASFKTSVVMELLRGESIEELSRKHGLTMAEIALISFNLIIIYNRHIFSIL
jgi:hypothetical protein